MSALRKLLNSPLGERRMARLSAAERATCEAVSADAADAVSQVGLGINAIGILLSRVSTDIGISVDEIHQVGWLLSELGDAIVVLDEIRCDADDRLNFEPSKGAAKP